MVVFIHFLSIAPKRSKKANEKEEKLVEKSKSKQLLQPSKKTRSVHIINVLSMMIYNNNNY